MELFDNHAHYDDEKFNDDREYILDQVYQSGVTKLISAGYNINSSKIGLELASKYDYIYTTCGISPNDIKETEEEINMQLEEIEELLINRLNYKQNDKTKYNKIVAIGEIGLDFHWNSNNKDLQIKAFIEQIKLANQYRLPIVIHTREAIMETLNVLKNKVNPEFGGIIHCAPLNIEFIKEVLKLGFYISFAGTITYKSSKNADEVINVIPLNKILVETDSPYLSPEPKRGTRNDSRNIKYVVEKIAQVKNIPSEEVANITYNNANEIYNIKKLLI